jgi:hypothetical protein
MKMEAGSPLFVQFNYAVSCHSFAGSRNCKLGPIWSMHYTVRIYTEVEVRLHLFFKIRVIGTWVDRVIF